ncbi:hypothetical protein C8A03DRAFT_37961 [Achaetomium macrosporum]|uniref:Uncharacterized protein n=1 Tax=Achaetomium macrosporum TaxID=79813 RepID=A0AAN7H4B8_9PEZI|nr:hypothetical protein C8A03DRAFT_37961 [Achaetomium macrosporum]
MLDSSNNSTNNIITAREKPGGPPLELGVLGKHCWAVNHPPADPTVSFAGKTVLVTGTNTGLGFEAAVKYAALGASRLILGVRSADKGEAAKQHIAFVQAVARATWTATSSPGGTEGQQQQQQEQQPEVIVHAVYPSQCKTDLGRQYGLMSEILMALSGPLFPHRRTGDAVLGERDGPVTREPRPILISGTMISCTPGKDETVMRQAWDEIFKVIVVAEPDLQLILAGHS